MRGFLLPEVYMSAKLGTLTLDLIAKIGNFVGPLKSAEAQVKSTTGNISNDMNTAKLDVTALSGVIAGLSVASLVSFSDQIIRTGVEIKQFAELTNQGVEQFQYYSRGAATVGVQMDKYADILKDVYDRLGEVKRGEGEMMDFFNIIAPKVGITADMFERLSGQEALQLYYNGLQQANLSQPEMITYMEQMANDASLLIPLLRDNGQGFKNLGDEAQKAGAILSEDTIASINQAKESLTILGYQFDGFQASLINSAIPAIEMLVDNFDGIVTAGLVVSSVVGSRLVVDLTKSAAGYVANTVATRNKILADYEMAKAGLAATAVYVKSTGVVNANTQALMANARAQYQQAAAAKSAMLATTSLTGVGRGALALFGGPFGLGLTLATVAGSFLLMSDNSKDTTQSLRENNATVEQAIGKYKELGEVKQRQQLVAEKEQLSNLTSEYENAESKLISYTLKVARHSDLTSEQAKALSSLVLQYKNGQLSLEELSRSLNSNSNIASDAKDQFNNLAGAVKTTGDEVKSQNGLILQLEDTFNRIGNAGDNAATGIGNATLSLSEFAKKASESGAIAKATNTLISKGYDPKLAAEFAELGIKNGKVTREEAAALIFKHKEQDRLNKSIEAYNKINSSSSNKDALKKADQIAKEQKASRAAIEYETMDEFKRIRVDYLKRVAEIEKANFGANRAEMLKKAEQSYLFEEEMYLRQITEEINTHKWSEEQKLNHFFETQKMIVSESGKYNDQIKELKLQALDEQYAIELRKTQWHALEMRQTIEDSIKGLSYDSEDVFARSSMSSLEYQRWALDRNRSEAQLGLQNQRVSVERDIMSSDAYGSDDERYQALTEAHRAYREGLAAIDAEYLEQVDSLQNAQYESTMNMYGSLLSQASSVWGDMTQLVKDSEGEQSSAYKAMFLMQQMFAIGSALVSTHLAAAQVLADPTALTMDQKTMYSSLILGMGYANVGLIAGQTLAGMAHDGIDNVPREGTWLLDKGERVVDKRTNADLKDYLANRGNSAPSVSVVIENYTTGQVQTRVDEEGQVRVIIRNELDRYFPSQMSNPNSKIHKSIVQNTTAKTNR